MSRPKRAECRPAADRPHLHLLASESDLVAELALKVEHSQPVVAAMLLAEIERAGRLEAVDGRPHRPQRRPGTERRDLHRQRETAEDGHAFALVGDDDHARRGRRHDLFAQEGAAAAFDQRQIGRDLVGAIHGDVELGQFVERGERNAPLLGVVARGLRGRDPDHVEAVAHPLPEKLDEMPGSRTGAEPEPHARPDEVQSLGRGSAFLKLGVHGHRQGIR